MLLLPFFVLIEVQAESKLPSRKTSLFDKKKPSSMRIMRIWHKCVEGTKHWRTDENTSFHYCACFIDYFRARKNSVGDSNLVDLSDLTSPKMKNQRNICYQRAVSRSQNPFGESMGPPKPNIYDKLSLDTEAIISNQVLCEMRLTKEHSVSFKIKLCGCMVDYIRVLFKQHRKLNDEIMEMMFSKKQYCFNYAQSNEDN